MKKIWAIAATAALSAALLLTGCGSDKSTPSSSNGNAKIIVGATPVPHAEILEEIKPVLAKEGVDLEIKESMPTSSNINHTWMNGMQPIMPTSYPLGAFTSNLWGSIPTQSRTSKTSQIELR